MPASPLHAPLPDAHARLCFVLPEALLIDGNMWDDAVITQKAKVKTLEDKFSAKMLENGVGVITCTSSVTLLFVFPTMHPVFYGYHNATVYLHNSLYWFLKSFT